jgi:hypothetical protein
MPFFKKQDTAKIIEDRLLGIKDKSITVFKVKTGE